MRNSSHVVSTTEDARAVIEDIARRKGTFTDAFKREAENEARYGRRGMLQAMESGEEIREDFSKLLKIISTDLYTSDARFLMEIIQNADDNKYIEGETPTLSITVFPRYVKIECNETGFSQENVQALCRTGRSSKPPNQGYTGEKGIGFKSVFKLANQVHIRSHPYYFQLDQRRDLGMITPQWDEDFFDKHEKEHQTTIILDDICNQSRTFSIALEKDVDAIDPVLIIFLRRIERLHLTLWTSSFQAKPAINKRFRRVQWTSMSGIVSLEDEDTKMMHEYYKQRFTTEFNGTESRRPGARETDVVLAFPVRNISGKYVFHMRKQNFAFAWLPLADLGYKFVIQADFLTTSNRQSVDEDNDWNKNIAAAIPHAFEAAIKEFNRKESGFQELAKTWPLYLRIYTFGLSPYWRSITKNIFEHLSSAFVIKDRAGYIRLPKDLMFLDWAHDRDGEPIFGSQWDYIAQDYPDTVREALSCLGVAAPSWDWMCDKLKVLHRTGSLNAKMQSAKWCSDLARVILERVESRNDAMVARDLRMIPLIPLTDSTWRCAPSEGDPIYFPASLGANIPPGLPLTLAEEAASKCPMRKRLFQLLGVKDCDVPSVIERILAYHTSFRSANAVHVIAQVKYLYKMKKHLRHGDMKNIYFACWTRNSELLELRKGMSAYANISSGGELRQLFSDCSNVGFLDEDYFVELNPPERARLARWLRDRAGVALAPRFIAARSGALHEDFKWLLENRSDQILATLRQHWIVYEKIITPNARDTLANHEFLCRSGSRVALHKTLIPLRALVQKTHIFGNVDHCHFLVLPSGAPEDWTFLSNLDVSLDDGLNYYLWMLGQSGFREQRDVNKWKKLYLEIQSRAFSPHEMDWVKEVFGNSFVNLGNGTFNQLRECVWEAPRAFSLKSTLRPVYGPELSRLFQLILGVSNLTINEAFTYLKHLQNDRSTSMADVVDVYVFLQVHYTDYRINYHQVACIAIPAVSDSALQWKTPAQCVWDDKEFSQNNIKLESKIALRPIIEQYTPTAKAFFTHMLGVPDAGIHELLADLKLMHSTNRDDPKRVHAIYERIESCHRIYSESIRHAFNVHPLVFLRGFNNERGQWLSLEDCVWTRSVLRSKYALMSSLNQYRGLFRETLGVPNATMDMLVTELLEVIDSDVEDEEKYSHVKELLQEIARLKQNDEDLEALEDEACWPCRKPTHTRDFCSIGSFYVNDRQDLFDIFADSHTFLDFNFDTSKRLTELLVSQGCESFLSENVSIDVECREPLRRDHPLTEDFRGRADSLVMYFEHVECESPYDLQPLLRNAEVWMSADIKTHYTLEDRTVTRSEGGSSAKICTEEDGTTKLKIYVSTNRQTRECALLTDFPDQLVDVLECEPADLPDLHLLLQVPLTSLKALMVRRGFAGWNIADDHEDNSVASPINENLQSPTETSDDENEDESTRAPISTLPTLPAVPVVVQSIYTSASSEAARTALQPNVTRRLSSGPITPEPQSHGSLNVPLDESLPERPTTPRPTIAGPYSRDVRNRNMERLRNFARNLDHTPVPRLPSFSSPSRSPDSAFDMSSLTRALGAAEPTPTSTSVQVTPNFRQRAGAIPNRNDEQRARDFEVGFLGEHFVYNLLHDTLELPNFSGEENWTSSLRSRAGFSNFGREVSDFTYKDAQGVLTRHFQGMEHQYTVPEWLVTICNNGNVPLYRLEVKSTTSQDHTTPFYMSSSQYNLAERLRVTSTTPSEVYVILRISGLNALEDDAQNQPQWRVYLDPYTRGIENVLKFVAPTYVVTPTA